ncbi:MAG: GHKL domain-containing protein [Sphingobacteriaceae bacterium]|nr:MAG: GHKL domain-containing protein [Sphingobacteriaceae bacterium]
MLKKNFSFLCALFFIVSVAKADLVITNNSNRILLGKNIYIYSPKNQEVSFDSILTSGNFSKSNKEIPNLGLSENSIWLKFTITNTSNISNLFLEIAYPLLDEVELYFPSNNYYKHIYLGESRKFKDRKYSSPNYIFDLNIPSGFSKTYYLRIRSTEQIIIPLYVSQPLYLWQSLNTENMIIGIYVGIVSIMFLYNLFIIFSVKDISYLYYVLYVAFAGLTQIGIKGYNYQFLWPNAPIFESKSVVIFANISGIAAIFFTKRFLLTKIYEKQLDILLTALIYVFLISICLTTIGMMQKGFLLMQITTSISSLMVLYVTCSIMIKGYKPAIFFFFAWFSLLIGATIFLLKDYGILPYNTFTSYSVQGASAIEMALLSFGLADRINIYKKEKEESQAQALFAFEENDRIIREQNVTLERKVEERTNELVFTNKSLNTTLTNLKEAQLQLVEAEKMASLGQLTAGIAHEINNPINFVTSNVTPLRRDVDILIDVINSIEAVGLSDISIIEKQQQIEDYKEEVDFDYVKLEIDNLLNGIHEGATRTADIVKGLKIFSRLDEDDIKKADINEGLASTLIIANNLIGNHIQVVKNLGNIPMIECYPGKLNQVFLNIISNAVFAIQEKFGDSKGGVLKITTECDNNSLFIKIEDNGTGMSEATKNKIFEPFFTTKDVGIGTGLGMSIVYNTINKHNGQITLNSSEGVGTEFIIELQTIFKETVTV